MQSKTDRIMCGTCEYWTGEREPVFDKKGNAKINIYDNYGVCCKMDCRFADQTRKKDAYCMKYSKWTELL